MYADDLPEKLSFLLVFLYIVEIIFILLYGRFDIL